MDASRFPSVESPVPDGAGSRPAPARHAENRGFAGAPVTAYQKASIAARPGAGAEGRVDLPPPRDQIDGDLLRNGAPAADLAMGPDQGRGVH